MTFGMCSDHQRDINASPPQHRCPICLRIKAEGQVARRLVEAALAKGWSVSVFDSEEWAVKRSRDAKAIMEALFATDDDMLRFRDANGEIMGNVYLVYGNAGYEVINDYSVSLETFMKPIEAFMDKRKH